MMCFFLFMFCYSTFFLFHVTFKYDLIVLVCFCVALIFANRERVKLNTNIYGDDEQWRRRSVFRFILNVCSIKMLNNSDLRSMSQSNGFSDRGDADGFGFKCITTTNTAMGLNQIGDCSVLGFNCTVINWFAWAARTQQLNLMSRTVRAADLILFVLLQHQ